MLVRLGWKFNQILNATKKLPAHEELRNYISWSNDIPDEAGIPRVTPAKLLNGIYTFCIQNGIYLVPNLEFIDALSEQIKPLGKGPIIEICAGNGKLSYHLNKNGIDIIPTDDYSWEISEDNDLVEKLSHKDALQKYQPKIVLCAWGIDKVSPDVLNHETVDYFICITAGTVGSYKLKPDISGFEIRRLQGVEKYTISAPTHSSSVILLERSQSD